MLMTKKDQLDYLTVQMKRLVNGQELGSDSLDMMLWTLEDLSAKEAKTANEPQLPNFDNSPERFMQLAKDRMAQRQGEL